MHRARGGLAPLFSHPHPPFSVSRRFRASSALSSKNVSKTTKQTLKDSALKYLRVARPRRGGLVTPKTHRATELKLVNSILEERRLPTAAEQGLQDVVRPMTPHPEESTEPPSCVGPGALVEVRW